MSPFWVQWTVASSRELFTFRHCSAQTRKSSTRISSLSSCSGPAIFMVDLTTPNLNDFKGYEFLVGTAFSPSSFAVASTLPSASTNSRSSVTVSPSGS